MATKLQDKEKNLLKQFLTYNLAQDYDDKQKREKFVEIFRNLVMTDAPEMKDIILSMFDSFNHYQATIDNPVDDEEPEEETPDEPVSNEETPEDGGDDASTEDAGPTEAEMDTQFESTMNIYVEKANDLLGWY